uniref:WW domain-binding protein 11 n=1 Tax=Rhabditophanes sp. KR3021 TaxID=114890 RepID=A0AC35TRY9_9BILA
MPKKYNPMEVERRAQKKKAISKGKQNRNTNRHQNMLNKDYESLLVHMKKVDENEVKGIMPAKAADERRKKLKQSYLDILKFYRTDGNKKEKVMELESKLRIYENEREFQLSVYLAEATAQHPETIPLPEGPMIPQNLLPMPPIFNPHLTQNMMSEDTNEVPGPPCGPIPNLIEVSKKLRTFFRYDDNGGGYKKEIPPPMLPNPSFLATAPPPPKQDQFKRSAPREFRTLDPSTSQHSEGVQISSAPVKRDKMAELTRLVPSHLMFQRETKAKPKHVYKGLSVGSSSQMGNDKFGANNLPRPSTEEKKQVSTDDAYDLFMKQMDNLL